MVERAIERCLQKYAPANQSFLKDGVTSAFEILDCLKSSPDEFATAALWDKASKASPADMAVEFLDNSPTCKRQYQHLPSEQKQKLHSLFLAVLRDVCAQWRTPAAPAQPVEDLHLTLFQKLRQDRKRSNKSSSSNKGSSKSQRTSTGSSSANSDDASSICFWLDCEESLSAMFE